MWRFCLTIVAAEKQQCALCVLPRYTSLSTTLSVAQQCFNGEFRLPAIIIGTLVDILIDFNHIWGFWTDCLFQSSLPNFMGIRSDGHDESNRSFSQTRFLQLCWCVLYMLRRVDWYIFTIVAKDVATSFSG
jgi:hypothetical protein